MTLGRRRARMDGMSRLTGAALYADDITLPGMLHAKLLRSPHAHANITHIDTSEALALDGVYDVITGAELTTSYGVIPWTPDEHALANGRVRYIGDAVAAVAAIDEETALAALALIDVSYDVLPAFTDPREALKNPESKIHERAKRGNVSKYVKLEFGDVDAALQQAHLVIEGDYQFHGTTHAAIEPHCAIGWAEPNGGLLTVWSATQVPHYLHRELAKVLDIPARRIRVIQPPVGGAFGGKSEPFDLEFAVALLSIRTGRPVKCLYTREEVFLAHRGRHPIHMKHKTGFDAQGRIVAADAVNLLDGGAYSSFGLVTAYYSGQLLTSPYAFGTYRFEATRVYTNKPACGPKRGHGSVQPRFALEVQLDKAAEALGLDPIELRRRCFSGENTRTVNHFHIRTSGYLKCLDAVSQASEWVKRRGQLPFGRGLGIACSTYISGTNYCIYPSDMPQSAVHVGLDRSGRVRVFAGVSEIGQGTHDMLATICCEELGCEPADVRVVGGDTDLCPVDLGAYSSRITLMAGHACIAAARALGDKVREALAAFWECKPTQVTLADGEAHRTDDPEQRMVLAEAFQKAEGLHGTLETVGSYDTPKEGIHGEYRGATIGASPVYSYTAHVAEVVVDVDTGEVTVERVWAAHDCGRALNPLLVEAQIEGSVYMGAAEAVMEHHHVMAVAGPGEDGPAVPGLLMGTGFLDYPIPTALDAPDVRALVIEEPDPLGPYGAREAGEGPLHPAIPAIANAVYDAIGVRVDHLPITPMGILAALRKKASNGEVA